VARKRSQPAHIVETRRGWQAVGMSADDPLDPAEGIVASTAAVLALRDLLVEKGIITSDEFVDALDRHSAFIVEQLRQRREAEGEAEGEGGGGRSWSRRGR
jgi:hypothetical protein